MGAKLKCPKQIKFATSYLSEYSITTCLNLTTDIYQVASNTKILPEMNNHLYEKQSLT